MYEYMTKNDIIKTKIRETKVAYADDFKDFTAREVNNQAFCQGSYLSNNHADIPYTNYVIFC